MTWFVLWSCAQPPPAPAPPPAAPVPAAPAVEPVVEELPTHRTSDVPCDEEEDCWFSDGDPAQPIARPPKLRNREFKPCIDGNFGLECHEGHCALRLGPAC